VRYRVISGWSRLVVWLLDRVCRIRWSVEGREHLPANPAVILPSTSRRGKRSLSRASCPPQVHVLKRELLWIPFFGWGLALMSPIAIDRSRGIAAMRQIARKGKQRPRAGILGDRVSGGHSRGARREAQVPAGRRMACFVRAGRRWSPWPTTPDACGRATRS
jgi:hypothetical protein